MESTLDELERLAALHRAGSLTDQEYEAQKARVLSASAAVAAPVSTHAPPSDAQLSRTWQRRFAFFHAHGSPFSTAGAIALQKLPFGTAISIRSNVWAFLFGPIYFFVLGLWKRGLSLTAVAIVLSLLADRLFGDVGLRVAGIVEAVIFSMTVNYYRFIKVTQGRDEWNPLTDLFVGRKAAEGGARDNGDA